MSEGQEKPFAEWIGRQTRSHDVVTDRLDASFRAVLGPHLAATQEGEAPGCIHWCLSPAIAPMDALGPDGHPAKNLDLPPVPLPRRMWAGGEIESFDALRIGDAVTRISTIADVTRKAGRSGELWFVAIDHAYETARGLAIRERQDLVYRAAASPDTPKPAAAPPAPAAEKRAIATSWTLTPSPVLLFRYSAITFNGHRIHYDHPYATGVEGYDGLVVHGPMQATLLYNLATVAGGKPPRRFSYRGVAPAIAGTELTACRGVGEDGDTYWTQGPTGRVHMEAKVAHA